MSSAKRHALSLGKGYLWLSLAAEGAETETDLPYRNPPLGELLTVS